MKELRALPVNAAILDASGTIVAVNDTWKDFARQNGLRLPNFGVGLNYLQFCESDGPYPSLSAADLKELLSGQKKLLTLIYPCDSPTKKRWFSLIGLQLSPDRPAGVALLHINLTDTLLAPDRCASKASHNTAREPNSHYGQFEGDQRDHRAYRIGNALIATEYDALGHSSWTCAQ